MGWFIWGVVLPACMAAAWLICRPAVAFAAEVREDGARRQFRLRREWLEARFLAALGRSDPLARILWEDAQWHDEILWARDRRSRRLLALIGVHFGPDPDGAHARHATALFEYRNGRWHADGKRLDETRPDQAMLAPGRFVPVVRPIRH